MNEGCDLVVTHQTEDRQELPREKRGRGMKVTREKPCW